MNEQDKFYRLFDSEFDSVELNLSAVINSIREGIIVVGANLRVIAANEVARRTFSITGESLKYKRLSEVLRNYSVHKAFQKALSDEFFRPATINLKIAGNRSFEVNVAPLSNSGQRAAVGVFHETTQIELLEKIRQEFLSNISHELRTPLTSILAFVETLESGAIDDRENNKRFLATIRKNAERMRLLINDISELSAIEAGVVSIVPKEVFLFGVVEEIVSAFRGKALERNISISNRIDESTLITADRVRLEQMLVNLLDNAIKFNKDGGAVTIQSSESADRFVIEVADTGEGIPSDQLNRIFERLYRVDRARSIQIGGTGLGLAIVKHLVILHNGEIDVSSSLGNGTTFKISLPRFTS